MCPLVAATSRGLPIPMRVGCWYSRRPGEGTNLLTATELTSIRFPNTAGDCSQRAGVHALVLTGIRRIKIYGPVPQSPCVLVQTTTLLAHALSVLRLPLHFNPFRLPVVDVSEEPMTTPRHQPPWPQTASQQCAASGRRTRLSGKPGSPQQPPPRC